MTRRDSQLQAARCTPSSWLPSAVVEFRRAQGDKVLAGFWRRLLVQVFTYSWVRPIHLWVHPMRSWVRSTYSQDRSMYLWINFKTYFEYSGVKVPHLFVHIIWNLQKYFQLPQFFSCIMSILANSYSPGHLQQDLNHGAEASHGAA